MKCFDVLCVQDSNVFDLLYKNIENFSFFEISQQVKLLDPITVLRTHINMAFAQILNYKNNIVSPTDKEIQAQWGKTP